MNTSNALLLTQLLLQYTSKISEIGALFRTAQADGNRDVSDAEVANSTVARDVQLAKTAKTVG
jgi:hypothetical protein